MPLTPTAAFPPPHPEPFQSAFRTPHPPSPRARLSCLAPCAAQRAGRRRLGADPVEPWSLVANRNYIIDSCLRSRTGDRGFWVRLLGGYASKSGQAAMRTRVAVASFVSSGVAVEVTERDAQRRLAPWAILAFSGRIRPLYYPEAPGAARLQIGAAFSSLGDSIPRS